MKIYSNDPRKISAKFGSTCSKCGKPIKKGETIIYWPYNKTAEHEACGADSYAQFIMSAQDEDLYNRAT